MKKYLTSIPGIFIGAAVMYGQVMGLYHSFDDHDDGYIAIFVPPYAWYRSVEYWWHDDFIDVDWDQRISVDGRNAIIMLNSYADPDPSNSSDVSRAIEKFSKEITSYPKEKSVKIYEITRLHSQYVESIMKDLISSLLILKSDQNIEFSVSENTKHFENLLATILKSDEIYEARKGVFEIFNTNKDKFSNKSISDEKVDFLISGLWAATKLQNERLFSGRKLMFGELFEEYEKNYRDTTP